MWSGERVTLHMCMHALAAKLRLAVCKEKLQMLPLFQCAIKKAQLGQKAKEAGGRERKRGMEEGGNSFKRNNKGGERHAGSLS